MDLSVKNLGYFDNFKHVVMSNYVNLKGRASRSEFWRYIAVYAVLNFVIQLGYAFFSYGFIHSLFSILDSILYYGLLLPSLGITVRRLHDTNLSGWLALLWLVPVIGWVAMIYLLSRVGDTYDNQYGPVVSYEIITRDMSMTTGLQETPSEDLDKKVMYGVIIIYVLTLFILYTRIKLAMLMLGL